MKQLSKQQSRLSFKAPLSILFFSILSAINCNAVDEQDGFVTPRGVINNSPSCPSIKDMWAKAKRNGPERIEPAASQEFVSAAQLMFEEFAQEHDDVLRHYGITVPSSAAFIPSSWLAKICNVTNEFFEDLASLHEFAKKAALGETINKSDLLDVVNRLDAGAQLLRQMSEPELSISAQVILFLMHSKYANDFSKISRRKEVTVDDLKIIYFYYLERAQAEQKANGCSLKVGVEDIFKQFHMNYYIQKLEQDIEAMDNFLEKCCKILLNKLAKDKELAKHEFCSKYDHTFDNSTSFLELLYQNESKVDAFYAHAFSNLEKQWIAKILGIANKANELNSVLDIVREPMKFIDHIDYLMGDIHALQDALK